ncbi:MAG TPA: ketopantoate reductase family protein [Burkholderiales bacterium]|nr:ketopantoate reductase family protein [Burkholderiales bacterium]
MGAGAVGCYYGAMLGRAGLEVTLIARPQHVEAVRSAGLRLQTSSSDEFIKLKASTEAEAVRGAQLVLFSVKSTDTEAAGKAMAPHLARDAAIVTLQNGVDNAERLAATLRREVIPAVVYVAVEMAGAGHVRHHGRGELVIGRARASQAIVAAFAGAGVKVEISDNVMGALWAKLIVNSAYNALSAITQLPYGRLVQNGGVPAIMDDVVDECLAVAKAAGVHVPGDMHDAVRRIAQTMPGQYSSTAQDLARKKKTEIEHLNGFVVRKGEALGVRTPVNGVLLALVRTLENRG